MMNVAGIYHYRRIGHDVRVLELLPGGSFWRGRWLKYEKMPVEIIPRRLEPLRSLENQNAINDIPGDFITSATLNSFKTA